MKVLLFDIDGTLALSGGAGMRSMEHVFAERYGIENAFENFQFQGKVDSAIFRECIHRHGLQVEDEDAEILALIREYERYVVQEMPKSHQAVMMPGVKELLDKLETLDHVAVGLLTGNVVGGAKAKLSYFDLWRYFPFGAFGSDNEQREELVPIALERASAYLGRRISPGPDVYVIGDTDRDIACAKANDCVAVGVATLGFTVEQLRELGADIVFKDLSDTDAVIDALGVGNG